MFFRIFEHLLPRARAWRLNPNKVVSGGASSSVPTPDEGKYLRKFGVDREY